MRCSALGYWYPKICKMSCGKNHGVPNVPTGPITRSKAKKIQQAFIIHLQNWIGSIEPSFNVLQVDSIEERLFGALEVNICTVEVADEVASIIS